MTFKAKKSLGQNFLTNPKVPEWMADAADLRTGDTVLEVGPGTGMLTREFLKRGAHVIAVEADRRAVEFLEEAFEDAIAERTLELRHGDIRDANLTALGLSDHSFKVIANIPYYLSGHLFRTFLESEVQPSTLVFLVQKEVAERIARDTKESLLSLSVKVFGEPQYVRTVSRGNFNPKPAVDSAIIAVSDISRDRLNGLDPASFFDILRLGFAAKRKQLLGNLSARYDRALLTNIFSTCSIPLTARGEDLSPETWLLLVHALVSHM